MALDKVTLSKLLDYLNERIASLENKKISTAKLEADEDVLFSVEHQLHTAIEAVINIAEHIVAGLNLGHVDTAKDTLKILAKSKIISTELAGKLEKAADMRNILVHHYFEIRLEKIAEASTSNLDDLREFAKAINTFLEKQQKAKSA